MVMGFLHVVQILATCTCPMASCPEACVPLLAGLFFLGFSLEGTMQLLHKDVWKKTPEGLQMAVSALSCSC
jgi:hypothetical protein